MGLDANYPAVTMNDPQGTVTVYDQDHVPIGHLGPSPYQSPSVNVRCRLKAWDDADWYRLLNPDGWDFPATTAYVSADETHELNPGIPYTPPDCANVGCRPSTTQVAGAALLALGTAAAAAAWHRHTNRS